MRRFKIINIVLLVINLSVFAFSIWVWVITRGFHLSVERVNHKGDEAVLIHEGDASNRNVFIKSLDGNIYSVSIHTIGMDVEFQDKDGDGKWDVWSTDIESNTNKLYYLYSRFSGYPYSAYGDQPSRVLIDGGYYEAENNGTNTYVIVDGEKIGIRLKNDMSEFELEDMIR